MPAVSFAPPRSPRRRRPQIVGAAIALMLAASAAALGCSGGEAPSAERFCGEVVDNRDALTNPTLEFSDDIEPLLDLYRDVGELAPLGVHAEWADLVAAYETASTVVPGDQASEQEALAAIYSAEKSAAAIGTWLQANCAVDIGPIFTIVPHGG